MKQVFIQIVGSSNDCIFKSGFIQHFPRFLGEIGEIPAVQTYAIPLQRISAVFHFLEYPDCIWNTRFQGIIGVYKKGAVVRIEICISAKSSIFIRKTHNPAVRMGTKYRYIKKLACQNIGSSNTAADHCGAGAVKAGIGSLGTAESKLHYTVPVSGKDDTGSLCGDQGLMINDIQDRCLYELCFHNRGNDLNERFFWKDYRSFGNSINISRKVEASEIVQEIFAEDPQTPEIIHILISEIQIFYIFNYLIQSGADRISASAWILAEEYVKDDGFILPLFVVSLHHSKFIEVSKQGKVVSVHCSF